jgi:hypothetical protein
MNARFPAPGVSCLAIALLVASMPAGAKTFHLSGTATQCTPTCNSFVFLGIGSLVDGFVTFDDDGIADGEWTGSDVTDFSFTVLDPAFPPFGPSDPPNPAVDNPFVLDPTADGGGMVVANGLAITNPRGTWQPCVPPMEVGCVRKSAGSTDGASLTGGFVDFWLTQGLLANNGAIVTLRLDEECIDELTPGAEPIPPPCFEVNIFEGQVFVAGGAIAPAGVDSDDDTLLDDADNCTLVANTDQRDTDGDGLGNICDADFNNDCIVNFRDLLYMRAVFQTPNPEADLNGDGTVDAADLVLLLGMRGLPPGPSGVPNVCNVRYASRNAST